MTTATDIEKILFELSDPQKKEFLPYFFKTGKGQYGEGDKFIGVVVPKQRMIVKQVEDISFEEIDKLLHSEYHECRLTGLLLLVKAYKKASKNGDRQKSIYDFYIGHYASVNNWDLVDLTAPNIVGAYLLDKPHDRLFEYAHSNHLWLQRIAIVSTFAFIRNGESDTTFEISKVLLHHEHDLIHKAVGWMLREVGKRNFDAEYNFLIENDRYKTMPRTMLRYAIEKFPENLRQNFLKGKI